MRYLILGSLMLLVACGGDETGGDETGGDETGGDETGGDDDGTGNGSACGHAGEPEPSAVAGITAAHNAARCAVPTSDPLPPLEWSAGIAATAQAYADTLASQGCSLTHSGSPFGENLFGGSGSYDGQFVVDVWMGEESCFTGTSVDDCSCVCGHYTQIVWRDSTRLGCGVGMCPGGGQVWVCNYDPAGNFIGQPPF